MLCVCVCVYLCVSSSSITVTVFSWAVVYLFICFVFHHKSNVGNSTPSDHPGSHNQRAVHRCGPVLGRASLENLPPPGRHQTTQQRRLLHRQRGQATHHGGWETCTGREQAETVWQFSCWGRYFLDSLVVEVWILLDNLVVEVWICWTAQLLRCVFVGQLGCWVVDLLDNLVVEVGMCWTTRLLR